MTVLCYIFIYCNRKHTNGSVMAQYWCLNYFQQILQTLNNLWKFLRFYFRSLLAIFFLSDPEPDWKKFKHLRFFNRCLAFYNTSVKQCSTYKRNKYLTIGIDNENIIFPPILISNSLIQVANLTPILLRQLRSRHRIPIGIEMRVIDTDFSVLFTITGPEMPQS